MEIRQMHTELHNLIARQKYYGTETPKELLEYFSAIERDVISPTELQQILETVR